MLYLRPPNTRATQTTTVLRNNNLHIDKDFLEVHPDLALLYQEIQAKELALKKLNAQKAALKDELRASKKELSKRLAVLQNWQQGELKSTQSFRKRGTRVNR